MDESDYRYVSVCPRHYRTIFFINKNAPIPQIRAVFEKNLKVWGGRYNLLVPVSNGEIPADYLPLIENFDADSILHDKSLSLQKIESLHFLNAKIQQMEEWIHLFVPGINYHYLLNESNHDFLQYNSDFTILHVQGIHAIPLVAKDFYQTNFALYDLHAGQDQLIRHFTNLSITKDNHEDINKIIGGKRPYYKSILSQLKICSCVYRPKDFSHNENFQLVVTDDSSSEDYFYFWNRQQYIERNDRLFQLIITQAELETLSAAPDFEQVLYNLSGHVELVSRTLPAEKLESHRAALQTAFKHIRFTTKKIESFPYPILDYRYINQLEAEKNKQLFRTNNDLLKLPLPKLNDKVNVQGGIAYDIEIEGPNVGATFQHIKFPGDYPFFQDGRVNKQHNLTVYHGAKTQSIALQIPDRESLFENRLYRYTRHEKDLQTGITHLRKSSAGKKMFALINLFGNKWDNLLGYLQDKFWLDVFRFDSIDKGNSDIPKGKGIFSYIDLRNERLLILNQFKDRINKNLEQQNVSEITEVQFDQILDREMPDVLEQLQDLVDLDAVFVGMKVKCANCGSKKWYPLKELQNKMTCSGCLNQIIPRAESPHYYKINEIVVNNLLNNPNSNGKEFDGNYVVLRTINYFRLHARKSFSYHSPMDYSISNAWPTQWASDIDILVIQDGDMILGEAKTNANDFNRKEIDNLIWIAKNVRPAKIIASFLFGEFDEEKKKQIEKEIAETHVEFLIHKVDLATYNSHLIFGFK